MPPGLNGGIQGRAAGKVRNDVAREGAARGLRIMAMVRDVGAAGRIQT